MRTNKRYSDAEKLKLLEEFQTSGVSMSQFQEEYGLGHCTISKWMIKFGMLKRQEPKSKMKMSPKSNKSLKSDNITERILEARIQQLEQELKSEKLRTLAYKTMIEIAEEELGIEISKKAGAKQ